VPERTLPAFESVLALDPGNLEAYVGAALAELPDTTRCLGWLERARAHVGEQPVLAIVRRHAERLRSGGDPPIPWEAGQAPRPEGSLELFAAGLLALETRLRIDERMLDDVLDHFQRAILCSRTPRAYLYTTWALAAAQSGNAVHCRQAAESLATLFPDLAETHYMIGQCLKDLDPVRAEAADRRCLEMRSDYADAHGALAELLADHGSADEAILHGRRAVELEPDQAQPHMQLGNTFAKLRDWTEAAASYRRALELQPEAMVVYNNLGGVLSSSGKHDEALVVLTEGMAHFPDAECLVSKAAWNHFALGHWEEAMDACRHALELEPTDVAVLSYLAASAIGARDYASALEACDQAIDLDPSLATSYKLKAQALSLLGRRDEAIDTLEQALRLGDGAHGTDLAEIQQQLDQLRRERR
jgi:tetratricopeptide (TPR) repeat protein